MTHLDPLDEYDEQANESSGIAEWLDIEIIPVALLKKWAGWTATGAEHKMIMFCELRDVIAENPGKPLMVIYDKAARAMRRSVSTLRKNLDIIREYDTALLMAWVENGLAFDHIEKANAISERAGRDPADILNDAITVGNEKGETMTVREMTAFALGGRKITTQEYFSNRLLESIDKFYQSFADRYQWDSGKRERFGVALKAFWGEWFISDSEA